LPQQFDVIVIGGGVNGTGIARDCAMRGLKTLLLEKEDFGAGASGGSGGMIHGGLRYLLHGVKTTRIACTDSGYIQAIAPHMIFRIPFIFPITDNLPVPKIAIEFVETFFEAYDRFQPRKKGKPHSRLDYGQVHRLEPGLSSAVLAGISTDEWGIDVYRLCAANALSAAEAGAQVLNHTRVDDILIEEGVPRRALGVKTTNTLDGSTAEYRARVTINASGPWLSKVAGFAGASSAKIRPSKGIHVVLDRRLTNFALAPTAIDGRTLYIIPHENTTIIGTTDDDYFGDLDRIPVLHDEIEYLIGAVEQVLPAIRSARPIQVWAAIRPTLHTYGIYEDDLSRDHEVWDHGKQDGISDFYTIGGGKLASYRLMSEDATDVLCKRLGVSARCSTHIAPLPGGVNRPDLHKLAERYGLPLFAVERMFFRHGSRMLQILEIMDAQPESKAIVCTCESVTEAELRYCIRHEMAVTVQDLRRRTRLGIGPCQGSRCTFGAAAILVDELDMGGSDYRRAIDDFRQDRWIAQRPVLRGKQLAQHEYGRNLIAHTVGLGPAWKAER
jgi:glycerol-3-phosphate dehydrogenase